MKNEKLKEMLKSAPVFGMMRADLEQKATANATTDTDADDSDDALDLVLTAKEIEFYYHSRCEREELQRRATNRLMQNAKKSPDVELRALVDELRVFENDAFRLDLLSRRLRGRHQERKESEIYAQALQRLREMEEMQATFKDVAAWAENILNERIQAEAKKREMERETELIWHDLEPTPIYTRKKKAEEMEEEWELEL